MANNKKTNNKSNKKTTSNKSNKKTNKKEIRDSIDIDQIQEQTKENKSNLDTENLLNNDNEKKSRKNFSDFLLEKRIPILSYIYKLFKIDFHNMRKNPNGKSDNWFLFRNTTYKKKFIFKLLYFIFSLLIGLSLFVIGCLILTDVIPTTNLVQGTDGPNAYLAAILMALGIILVGFM